MSEPTQTDPEVHDIHKILVLREIANDCRVVLNGEHADIHYSKHNDEHRIPGYGIFNLPQLIFRDDVTDAKQQLEEVCHSKYLARELMTKVYRMKDREHREIENYEYTTAGCRFTSNHFDKAETHQALHRLRLLHGTDDKKSPIFSNAVLAVSVDALLDVHKNLGEKNIPVLKHVKDNCVLTTFNKCPH